MAEYLVLLHEDPVRTRKFSPTEVQALIQRYREWIGGLREQGLVSVGKKLKDEGGRHLRGERGKMVVSDGPNAAADLAESDTLAELFRRRAKGLAKQT